MTIILHSMIVIFKSPECSSNLMLLQILQSADKTQKKNVIYKLLLLYLRDFGVTPDSVGRGGYKTDNTINVGSVIICIKISLLTLQSVMVIFNDIFQLKL